MKRLRLTNMVSGLLISAIILLFYNGTTNRIMKVSYDRFSPNFDSLSEESPSTERKIVFNPDIISLFYEKGRDLLSPKWDNSNKIAQIITAIKNVPADGLIPDDYHISDIENLAEKIAVSDKAAVEDINRIELLLTEALLLLSSHMAAGKTDPADVDLQWKASRRSLRQNWSNFIDSTLNTNNITEFLKNLTPRHRDYANLKKALAEYRQLEAMGGWGSFSTSLPRLEKGMRHPDISSLRKRLAAATGYIQFNPDDEDLFDQDLQDQVIRFQQNNGLEADGVVGKATVQILNIPVKERIETIEANLERWRWISNDLGDRYIIVNAAGFDLRAIENDNQAFETRVIVGSPSRQTPVFSGMMKYMVLNPDWVVPPSILKLDVIPEVIKDTAYLANKKMKIIRMDGTKVNSSSIDWKSLPEKRFPYMILQEPGQNNPLGRIKFMFANQYDVYIHDTPSRSLFLRNVRTFSSGCIRIDNPFEMAQYLLKDDPDWNTARLQQVIDKGEKRIIILKNPIPVHILYLTAWADDNGIVYFGKDIYNRDRKLITALKQNASGNTHQKSETSPQVLSPL